MTPLEQYQIMVEYCKMKVDQGDWHGVSDAANDIRELIALHPELKQQKDYTIIKNQL